MSSPTEVQLAYMAGAVDSDGSICIISLAVHKRHVIKLVMTNTDVRIMKVFEHAFGGKMRQRVWKNMNWKPCYEWTITADAAAKAIRQIFPYLIIKREQAKLALKLDRLKKIVSAGRCRWDMSYNNKRQRVYDRLKERCGRLNQRGVLHSDTRSYSGIQKNSTIREEATTDSSCL